MTEQNLTVRVTVDAASPRSDVERTLASIGRTRRALRQSLRGVAIVLVAPPDRAVELGAIAWHEVCRLPVSVRSTADADWDVPLGYVAVCRAGEFVDRRFLPRAVELLDRFGSRAIVHPHHVLVATTPPRLLRLPDTRRDHIPLDAFVDGDPWPGILCTSTGVLQTVGDPRGDRTTAGSEWATEAIRLAIHHLTVPSIEVIPAEAWGPPTEPPAAPPLDVVSTGLRALLPPAPARPGALSQWEEQHPIVSGPIRIVRRGRRGALRRARALGARFDDRRARHDARRRLRSLGAAEATVPQHAEPPGTPHPQSAPSSSVVAAGWRDLGGSADILIVTPRISTRSDDQVGLAYAKALIARSPEGTRIVLATTGEPGTTESGLIPVQITHYPLSQAFRELVPELRVRVITQLALALGSGHMIVIDDELAEASARIRLGAGRDTKVWVHTARGLDASVMYDPGSQPRSSRIIAEGPHAARRAAARFGLTLDDVEVLVPPPLPVTPEFDSVTQYTAAHDDVEFDDAHPFHVLWRTTDDDGPQRRDALVRLAETIAARELPVRLHLHHEIGSRAGSGSGAPVAPVLQDHGEFSGGLRDIPTENYHALIVDAAAQSRASTLQAMLLGLTIIAAPTPDADIIDETTALIVSNAEPDALADAIEGLLVSRDLRRLLIRGAYDRAASLVDSDPFPDAVARILTAR